MKTKQKNPIASILTEIALTLTPFILDGGRRWLESYLRSGDSAPARKRRKSATPSSAPLLSQAAVAQKAASIKDRRLAARNI